MVNASTDRYAAQCAVPVVCLIRKCQCILPYQSVCLVLKSLNNIVSDQSVSLDNLNTVKRSA